LFSENRLASASVVPLEAWRLLAYQAKAANRAASSNGFIYLLLAKSGPPKPCAPVLDRQVQTSCRRKKHRLCADSPLPDETDLPPFLCGFGPAFPPVAHQLINDCFFAQILAVWYTRIPSLPPMLDSPSLLALFLLMDEPRREKKGGFPAEKVILDPSCFATRNE
jgi:hypothetical protein